MLNQAEIDRLLETGNWLVRMDNEGVSYAGFRWEPLDKWTTAPDWEDKAECGNGLHGQNAKGHGYCQGGTRLVLCETKGDQVIIDKDKVKVKYAKIIAINEDIPPQFLELCSLDLRNYQHPLPAGLKSVGGYLDLSNYQHPLPAGLKSVGGSLYLRNYQHPLPAGLKSVGGSLDLSNYQHPLPAGPKSVGGDLDLRNYQHPLPAGLKKKKR